MGKWAGEHSFAQQHGCYHINVWGFPELWTVATFALLDTSTWHLEKYYKMWLFTLCENFVKKVVNLNLWWYHRKPRIYSILGSTVSYKFKIDHSRWSLSIVILCCFINISLWNVLRVSKLIALTLEMCFQHEVSMGRKQVGWKWDASYLFLNWERN